MYVEALGLLADCCIDAVLRRAAAAASSLLGVSTAVGASSAAEEEGEALACLASAVGSALRSLEEAVRRLLSKRSETAPPSSQQADRAPPPVVALCEMTTALKGLSLVLEADALLLHQLCELYAADLRSVFSKSELLSLLCLNANLRGCHRDARRVLLCAFADEEQPRRSQRR